MDRNTIIGLALIGLILVGYSIFTKPAREAQMEETRRRDSIARVEQIRALEAARHATVPVAEVAADFRESPRIPLQ